MKIRRNRKKTSNLIIALETGSRIRLAFYRTRVIILLFIAINLAFLSMIYSKISGSEEVYYLAWGVAMGIMIMTYSQIKKLSNDYKSLAYLVRKYENLEKLIDKKLS